MNVREEDLEEVSPPPRLGEPVEALVVLVAAGRSTRIPGDLPKQLLPLGGVPVVARAAAAFERARGVVGILPVHPAGMEREVLEALRSVRLTRLLPGVAGGRTRQESVALGVEALPDSGAVVLVHDAARPLVSPRLVERVMAAAARHGAAVPVRPILDTIKEVAGEAVLRTLDRDRLVTAQTPQGFRRGLLVEAVRAAMDEGVEATDEATLVERLGHPVIAVPGEACNLKLTEPCDLALAEFYLQEEGGGCLDA